MKKQCNLLLAVIGVTALILGGCSSNSSANADTSLQSDETSIDTQIETQDSTIDFDQNATSDTQIETQDSTKNSDQNTTSDNSDGEQTDTELDEQLARYRQEREDTIQEANGLIEGGSPDEKNYTFDLSGTAYSSQFDTREITEAYAAARIYVTDTLGITPNTKHQTSGLYVCRSQNTVNL